MIVSILVSNRENHLGKISAIMPDKHEWGKAEGAPDFIQTTLDVDDKEDLVELQSSFLYNVDTKKFISQIDKSEFSIGCTIKKADYSYDSTADIKVATNLNAGSVISDTCSYLKPDGFDLNEVYEFRKYWIKTFYAHRNLKGVKELLTKIKYGSFAENYATACNLDKEVRDKIFSTETISESMYNWVKTKGKNTI